MERQVNITVDAVGGVMPRSPQYAGVQGEHNACRVVFDVTAWANEPFLYRGEFVGGDGAGGTTAVLVPEDGCVSFLLPASWTAAGGRAVARLVASITVDGEETQTVYAVDVPLYFAAKQEYDDTVREEAYTGFTALAAAVQNAVDTVEEKLADGSFIGAQGKEGPQGVSGVYVGGGEMPDGYNVQVDPTAKTEFTLPDLELIASGELSDKRNFWSIECDNNGNPFSLYDRVEILVEVPQAEQDTKLSVGINKAKPHEAYCQINNGTSVSGARVVRVIWQYGTMGWHWMGGSTTEGQPYANVQMQMNSLGAWKEHNISFISLFCYTSSHTLPRGTKFSIYGRRA
ncbi:MAG: hypothetical protein E7552_02630 [Ruminococcaceae bacterium]|nr:hypothetical protein [Oscillospiraceae bacterium]